jgi:hypothetical protein
MQKACNDDETCQKKRLFDVYLYPRFYLCFFVHGKKRESCMTESDTVQWTEELLWSFEELLQKHSTRYNGETMYLNVFKTVF